MAHESFEDDDVAKRLNEDFISIKVDREERPDVDAVYMAVCQALTGNGGWPLTILMTPEQKPFFAGTYFPKYSRLNMPGITDILGKISYNWGNNRSQLTDAADTLTDFLQGKKSDETPGKQDRPERHDRPEKRERLERQDRLGLEDGYSYAADYKETIAEAVSVFYTTFDRINGGFGRAPKFPTPHNLMMLMKYYKEEGDNQALEIVEKTLQQMYRGGMFDHIGGGFARYSTDERWLAPHFEKMLYDNALLVTTYLEAYEMTEAPLYRYIAEKSMNYIMSEMRDASGGFYSAQDADSEGEEGKFYTFTSKEVVGVLGKDDGEYFNVFFDITETGNFEGKNIVNLLKNPRYKEQDARIEKMIPKIYDYRAGRMALHKDDKILTSWNCLMIAAFAKAFKVLNDNKYLQCAKSALQFIEQHMTDSGGRLLARYRQGEAGILGYLDDYAFYAYALIEMYEATNDEQYWQRAEVITRQMIELFQDENHGGFYLYANDAEQLIARPKELYDGAIPSGNSVAAYNLVKLSHLSPKDSKLSETAYKQINTFARNVKQYPAGYSFFMLALMQEVYHNHEQVMLACGPQGCSVSQGCSIH